MTAIFSEYIIFYGNANIFNLVSYTELRNNQGVDFYLFEPGTADEMYHQIYIILFQFESGADSDSSNSGVKFFFSNNES